MTKRIENKIGRVFIPVADMPRAITFYSHLFGLPLEDTSHEGKIYDVPVSGEVGLSLDSHRPVTNSSHLTFVDPDGNRLMVCQPNH